MSLEFWLKPNKWSSLPVLGLKTKFWKYQASTGLTVADVVGEPVGEVPQVGVVAHADVVPRLREGRDGAQLRLVRPPADAQHDHVDPGTLGAERSLVGGIAEMTHGVTTICKYD